MEETIVNSLSWYRKDFWDQIMWPYNFLYWIESGSFEEG